MLLTKYAKISRRLFSTTNNTYSGIKCGDIIYNCLKENNVKHVFMVSGGAIMSVIDAFHGKKDIKFFVNTHEQNAGHAATGYAKSSNKIGVVIVTSGPGLTNLITPMLDATNDSTPLVVISGQVPLRFMGTLAFQECPAVEITKPITKWSYCIKNVEEVPIVINLAFAMANDGKKGSVHIDLPKCIASSVYPAQITSSFSSDYLTEVKKKIIAIKNNLITFNYLDIIKFSYIINQSESPVIIVGKGCSDYPEELRKFAIKANIPVTSTLHGMGIFDETHKLALKFHGMHGSAYSNFAIQKADCIIAIGSRFDDRTTGNLEKYAPNAKNIIHVNINKLELNKIIKNSHSLLADCGRFLNAITPLIDHARRIPWFNYINELKVKYPLRYNKDPHNIKTQSVIIEINKQTRNLDNVIFTMGVGNHMMMACQFIDWRRPKQVIASGSLGVMGCSNGYAMGSKIANPDSMVISIDGDGSFNMTSNELKTIAEYNIPIKIAIMNDESLQMVRIWEELFFEGRIMATDNKFNPSYTQLANAYGIKSLYCDNYAELPLTIKQFLDYPGPIICEFKVKPDICLPLVGPGKSLDEMILFDEYHKNNKSKKSKKLVDLSGEAPS
jgi:acetolactate synthase-1/2/3 large subunit